MRLESINNQAMREPKGFTFLMCAAETLETVLVFVADEALEGLMLISDKAKLRAQLEAERSDFEEVARVKFNRGQVTPNGGVAITLADVVGFMS